MPCSENRGELWCLPSLAWGNVHSSSEKRHNRDNSQEHLQAVRSRLWSHTSPPPSHLHPPQKQHPKGTVTLTLKGYAKYCFLNRLEKPLPDLRNLKACSTTCITSHEEIWWHSLTRRKDYHKTDCQDSVKVLISMSLLTFIRLSEKNRHGLKRRCFNV